MSARSKRAGVAGEEARYSIRAVERAIAVLNAFSTDAPDLSLVELTRETGLSKPTVFRLLTTLERHGYVAIDAARARYRLGPKLLHLGGVAFSSLTLRKASQPHLTNLQSRTGATVLLGVLLDDQLVYVDKRETAGPIRIVSDIGWRRAPHFGMLGMTLMAFLTDDETERLLAEAPLVPHTRHSIVDREVFQRRLDDARREGCVVEFDEAIEGVWGVAAPVWDYSGSVVAAVGATSPASDRSDERVALVTAAVKACAAEISRDLGHTGVPPGGSTAPRAGEGRP